MRTGQSSGSVKTQPGPRMYNTAQSPACLPPETGTQRGHRSHNVQMSLFLILPTAWVCSAQEALGFYLISLR